MNYKRFKYLNLSQYQLRKSTNWHAGGSLKVITCCLACLNIYIYIYMCDMRLISVDDLNKANGFEMFESVKPIKY